MAELKRVKSRLTGYLRYEAPQRAVLKDTLQQLSERLPSTTIFGGMLRDFGLGEARSFCSDIDLVAIATPRDIGLAVKTFRPTRNKFGGFRFASGKWRFDIWAFDETWAFKQGLVKGTILTDLLKTTFFNVDAAIFQLRRGQLAYSPGYEEGLINRVLEINLPENPAPARMALRAIRFAVEKNLAVGPQLGEFILAHATQRGPGLQASFLRGLERHLRVNAEIPYRYAPQQPIRF